MPRLPRLSGLAVLAVLLAACGAGESITPNPPGPPPAPPPPPPPPAPVVVSVEVSSPVTQLVIGGTATLAATARDQAGAAIAGKVATWTASPPAVASVSAAGVVTALQAGSSQITATIDGKTGSAVIEVQPAAAASCTSCLEVVPASLLLPASGAQQQLAVYSVNAAGQRTAVAATFESSNPASVTVSPTGVATAAGPSGSSQIIARAGTQTAAPVLALVAQPAAGSALVHDGQVVGDIIPVNPAAPYGPGYQYRVRLRGPAPQVGQMVLGSGNAPIGGRVVSVAPVGTDQFDVVLAVAPLKEMLPSLSLSQTTSLANAPTSTANAAHSRFLRSLRTTPGKANFDIGPFECEVEGGVGLSFPLSVGSVNLQLDHSLSLDLVVTNGELKRLLLHGTVSPQFNVVPVIDVAVNGSVECKMIVAEVILPIGGPLALILGGNIPLGGGVAVEAETSLGGLGFDAFLQSTVTLTFGLDCAPDCRIVSDASETTGGFLKPIVPNLTTDMRTEFSASVFALAGLTLGNPFLKALQLETVEIKAGLQQTAELAGLRAQASDQGYGSSFELKLFLEAGVSSDLEALGGLVSMDLAEFKFEPELPTLARSPAGTFAISPAKVTAGDAQNLGEMAKFTVALNPVTFFGLYAVEGVEIFWEKTPGGVLTLEPGRPSCRSIAPGSSGQTVFECETDFLEQDEGVQNFRAFVKAKLFGISVPILLEAGEDAAASVEVTKGKVDVLPASVALAPGAQRQFTATVTGFTNKAVTWTATGGTITSTGLFTAGSGGGSFTVKATTVADPPKSGTASVQITAPVITVAVSPSNSSVVKGGQVSFSATVTGTTNTAVTWSAGGGGITSAGLYTAGNTPGTFTVTATSVADPTKKGSTSITIVSGTPAPTPSWSVRNINSLPLSSPAKFRLRAVNLASAGLDFDEARWTFFAHSDVDSFHDPILTAALSSAVTGPTTVDQFTTEFIATVSFPAVWATGFFLHPMIIAQACAFKNGVVVRNFQQAPLCSSDTLRLP
jgi:hypothetical protein